MGYFQVRYDSRVVNYDRRGFIRLATGLQFYKFGFKCVSHYIQITKYYFLVKSSLVNLEKCLRYSYSDPSPTVNVT